VLDRVLDHVDHLVQLVGCEHVGLSTDHGLGNIPAAVNRADKLPNLTRALVERGYTDDTVRAILGRNFLRLFGRG
jgi:membrane dipeptidase